MLRKPVRSISACVCVCVCVCVCGDEALVGATISKLLLQVSSETFAF